MRRVGKGRRAGGHLPLGRRGSRGAVTVCPGGGSGGAGAARRMALGGERTPRERLERPRRSVASARSQRLWICHWWQAAGVLLVEMRWGGIAFHRKRAEQPQVCLRGLQIWKSQVQFLPLPASHLTGDILDDHVF